MFDNNESCGNFIDFLLSRLTLEQRKILDIVNKQNQESNFIDKAVYSKNRNFRLYLSSKFGKNKPYVCFTESTLD